MHPSKSDLPQALGIVAGLRLAMVSPMDTTGQLSKGAATVAYAAPPGWTRPQCCGGNSWRQALKRNRETTRIVIVRGSPTGHVPGREPLAVAPRW